MEHLVGIDIGGTGVRAAAVDPHGALTTPVVREALSDRSLSAVVGAIVAATGRLGLDPAGIGIGVPGFVRRGTVVASPNFPTLRDAPIAAAVAKATGCPTVALNDANAATWGAYCTGGATENIVLLTLGTGVGGGVVHAGRLLSGIHGGGAELGHTYAGGDRPCGCGAHGCLETWCSTVGLVAAAAEAGQVVSAGVDVVRAARAGQRWALDIMEAAAAALGRSLIGFVNVFDPQRIVIVGGLAAARDLWGAAESAIRERAVLPSRRPVVVEWRGRADELAIAGAGLWVRRHVHSQT